MDVNTGAVGAALFNVTTLTTGSPAENSNGMGYNTTNGKFYYFWRSAALAAPFHEFVSYDPATATLTNLSLAGFMSATTRKVRSGCVNNTGTGYYCFDAGGGAVPPSLYYFDIAAAVNPWTQITSVFKNGATDVSANFKNLNSGDMAF